MAAPEEEQVVDEEAKRVERAADSTAEVNILDSVNMPLNDAQIGKLLHANLNIEFFLYHDDFTILSLPLIPCDEIK